jgi:hypothetical protein
VSAFRASDPIDRLQSSDTITRGQAWAARRLRIDYERGCLQQKGCVDLSRSSGGGFEPGTGPAEFFQPMPKRIVVKLYHRARDFERRTRQPGKQDGALGRNGLAVLHALIFDCLDFRTGRLDPGYATIARKACLSIRSAARGLQNLKLSGVLNWRRCTAIFKDGRCILDQDTNAYAILPSSQWRGYVEPPEAPPPQSGTWGDHPCGMRAPMIEADIEQRSGGNMEAVIRQLELDQPGSVAVALASLGRGMLAKKT